MNNTYNETKSIFKSNKEDDYYTVTVTVLIPSREDSRLTPIILSVLVYMIKPYHPSVNWMTHPSEPVELYRKLECYPTSSASDIIRQAIKLIDGIDLDWIENNVVKQ